jgi:hypothetical protein
MSGPRFAELWRINIPCYVNNKELMLSSNFATLAFDLFVKFFILKHSKEEFYELLCVSAAIIAYPMRIFFYQDGRRCVSTASVPSHHGTCQFQSPKAPVLPPFFSTAAPCGRFWIDGRLPGPSDVPPIPVTVF